MPIRQPIKPVKPVLSRKAKRKRQGAIGLLVVSLIVMFCAIGYYGYNQFKIYQQQQADINSLGTQGTAIVNSAKKQTRGTASAIDLQNQKLKTIGAIMIPKIAMRLPIFSDSSDAALEIGAGWLPASSPIGGGPSTHAVIDGHTGKAKPLFTWITDLRSGDKIYLKVGKKMLEYEVINRNKKNDGVHDRTYVKDLAPQEGKDLITLITCYPLLQNKQRLHVTAKRVAYDGRANQVSFWAFLMNYRMELVVLILLIVIPTSAFIIVKWRRKKENRHATK